MTRSITELYNESNFITSHRVRGFTISLQLQTPQVGFSNFAFNSSRGNDHNFNPVILEFHSKGITEAMHRSFSSTIDASPWSRLISYHTSDINDYISA